jgi:hypothetical protein
LRFEARHNVLFALDLLGLFVAQSIFSGLKPLAKTFDSGGILFSFFASCLPGFEFGFQVIGAFFGTAKCI